MPGYSDQQESWIYEGHLFHPYDATKEKGRWKKTWDRAGPKFMRTEEEKKKHEDKKKKHQRKDVRDRLHQLLHPYSMRSLEAKRKARLKASSAPASSSTAGGMGSNAAASSSAGGDAAISSHTTDGKDVPKPSHVPLRSYLRPCNIIGGGFLCTKAGYLPRFVVAYWERHCRTAS